LNGRVGAGDEPEVELAEALGQVARALAVEHDDPERTYRRICTLAVATMEHCESAGMSLVRGRKRIESLAGTDEIPLDIDRFQAETGQGPCIDAIREKEVFTTGHLSEEQRWPEFTRRATDATGIESILSFRLFVEEDTMGALNLYSTRVDAFGDHDHAVGAVFAAHAAVAMRYSRREEELERKAETRDIIGQAKGMLMAREHISEEQAFDILRRASQRLNMKLRDVADRMVHGEHPNASKHQ
jgi:transcriptional regulator with GAF, ATPase, and Fis domain